MSYPERVETERLTLRRWRASDASAMEAIWREPEVWDALQPNRPYDPQQWRSMLDRYVRHWDVHGFGLWAVTTPDEPQPMGWVGASHPTFVPELAGEVEIGWTLRPALWGRGLATEAAIAATAAAFAELPNDRVISLIHPRNERSMAVAHRLGMSRAGEATPPDLGEPLIVYALSRSSWSSSSSRGASAQSTSSR
ncbi:MAG: GNAT family N-acetyltransferase [Solirubrobacterales bacterium]